MNPAISDIRAVEFTPSRDGYSSVLPEPLGQKRHPARHPAIWSSVLDALDRLPRPQPDQGENALAGSLEMLAIHRLNLKSFGERIMAKDTG